MLHAARDGETVARPHHSKLYHLSIQKDRLKWVWFDFWREREGERERFCNYEMSALISAVVENRLEHQR